MDEYKRPIYCRKCGRKLCIAKMDMGYDDQTGKKRTDGIKQLICLNSWCDNFRIGQ